VSAIRRARPRAAGRACRRVRDPAFLRLEVPEDLERQVRDQAQVLLACSRAVAPPWALQQEHVVRIEVRADCRPAPHELTIRSSSRA
jgi:hypothetical protein